MQPARPILDQPEQEQAAEQHVEQLRPRSPGGRAGQRADQGQDHRRRSGQSSPAQQQVEADRGRRHHPGEDRNQPRQTARLEEEVHREIGQPFMHHPGMAGGAERIHVGVGDRVRRQHQPPVCQVPPEVGIEWRDRRQAEDGRESGWLPRHVRTHPP